MPLDKASESPAKGSHLISCAKTWRHYFHKFMVTQLPDDGDPWINNDGDAIVHGVDNFFFFFY